MDLSKVDLVVFSACETGLGRAQSGEGLMKSIYSKLWVEGMTRGEALRQAQLEMLKQNRTRYKGNGMPSTWGAFVLSGDWR